MDVEKRVVSTTQKGALIFTKRETPNKRIILVIMANKSPIRIKDFLSFIGNRFAEIEIKIMLSIPKTISKKVSVKKAEISSEERMKIGAYLIFFVVPLCTFLVSPTKAYSKVYSASFVDKISIRIGRLS